MLAKPDSSLSSKAAAFANTQPIFLAYGAGISLVSPTLTGWQLTKVFSRPTPFPTLARLGAQIFPHQVALKAMQMNAATPVKECASPWLAFGLVGVLQGGVYGQCTVHYSRALKLAKEVSIAGLFRGSVFAGVRDTISQGVPFMCSASVQAALVDPLLAMTPLPEADSASGSAVRKVVAVGSTSVAATFASQFFHNAQIKMQGDHSLSYPKAVSSIWREHGVKVLWMGGSARVALLLLVNGLNEALLKRAWNKE